MKYFSIWKEKICHPRNFLWMNFLFVLFFQLLQIALNSIISAKMNVWKVSSNPRFININTNKMFVFFDLVEWFLNSPTKTAQNRDLYSSKTSTIRTFQIIKIFVSFSPALLKYLFTLLWAFKPTYFIRMIFWTYFLWFFCKWKGNFSKKIFLNHEIKGVLLLF